VSTFFLEVNMKLGSLAAALAAVTALAGSTAEASSIYDFQVVDIEGRSVNLEQYRGKVLLIVNVASRCGYTYQYEGLEALYREYAGRGLVVLGFPSNDFLGQEPGSNEQIKEFCSLKYGVSFPMFARIRVKGRDAHPLYKFLTDKRTNPRFAGGITWNFNKFLVGRDGVVLARFQTKEEPASEPVRKALEQALGS
jgi:glutathione peroxidase